MRYLLTVLPLLTAFAQSPAPTLHPKALPPRPAVSLEELRRQFADPPAEFRPMPLWVWNDEMSEPRIREMLAAYRQQGFGGVFIHPRPGLITEYLGTDWFRLWRFAMEEGKRLGLIVNIYDENSYPSGFAGGHVPSRAPDTSSQYVTADTDQRASAVSSNPLVVAFFAVKNDAAGQVTAARRVTSKNEVAADETVTSFRLRRASGNPWTGEFPYVDLTNPRTTPMFVETTYEAYKREVGAEFGKTVKWSFSDEPLLATAGAYDNARNALPLSFYTLSEFRRRNGYDLADHIASLYWDTGDFPKVRFDYWQTLHDLWKENFMAPMFAWCDRNGLQFTGHWMEHEWPYPWITPDDASLYAFEHVPGIDMLEGTNLRRTGEDPHMLFTIRQVASVSHQLGRRAFCEAYGVAGWDSTFEHYKRFGDWLLVNGINFMDQHLSFTTIRGARKRDHPQSFSDVSAWFPYYRAHNDHLARVSYLSSLTRARNRVLLLQQTTSGFLYARRAAATPELAKMRDDNATLNQFLAGRQVDYDLGDEYMLEWFGQVKGRKFAVGEAEYDVLVLPPDLTNLRHETLPLLERWLAAGGTVLSLSPAPTYVDGRPSEAPAALKARYRAQWIDVDTPQSLVTELGRRLAPRIRFVDAVPASVGFSERYLANGDRVLFLINSGLATVKTTATVEAGSLEQWDTESGRTAPATWTASGGKVTFLVELAPAGSMLLVARTAAGPAAVAPVKQQDALPAVSWAARPDGPNVLALDYCDLTVGAESFSGINTWKANWMIWQRHGFERPAWDNAVQFKRSVLDRNHFDARSGFEAVFHFDVAAGVDRASLKLAVETPELYRIALNGQPVDFRDAARWLDPHLRAAPIGTLVREGRNEVRITAHPFDVHMELENIYLTGAFAAAPAGLGFRLQPAQPLALGPWAAQGYPFYSGSVVYSARIEVPAGHTGLRVRLPEWSGSLAVIRVDGQQKALLGWPPYEATVAAPAGAHQVEIQVVSTPRNTFGPFHNPTKPRMRAWPAAWAEFPEHQPAGAAYDVLDYGLMKAPELAAVR